MTHEGRMKRGEENLKRGLKNNADTQYYLEHKDKPISKPEVKKSSKEK